MNEEQLAALIAYIETKIDEKIERAFGRESWHETSRNCDAKDDLIKAFQLTSEDIFNHV